MVLYVKVIKVSDSDDKEDDECFICSVYLACVLFNRTVECAVLYVAS